jgi:F0F1-type ATP synthase assembly protein I
MVAISGSGDDTAGEYCARSQQRVKKGVAWSLAWNMSWTMVFSLLIPLMAGIWLDRKLDTAPLFILIGAVLGILAATVGVARMAIRTFGQIVPEDQEQEAGENGKEEPE